MEQVVRQGLVEHQVLRGHQVLQVLVEQAVLQELQVRPEQVVLRELVERQVQVV